jgi:TolB-like protein/DNA-binding winged helix-turn-helix (wHTH) protein
VWVSWGLCLAVSSNSRGVARFSNFELDLDSGEIRRAGTQLKLQPQPAKILALLVSRAGEVISRDELAAKVWGSETFVDFEQGLNFAVRQIRTVLGDDADQPRFLETLPKRGYRFIAPLLETPPPQPESRPGLPAWSWAAKVSAALVALCLAGVAAYLGWTRLRPHGPPRAEVLAVLPFDDLSPDPEDYLVDGLTEEMTAQLTRISPDLHVIARTSAMQYVRTRKNAHQIGEELGADYILENSIRHEGGRLRITAQLVRTADQTHLWAENYDRKMSELLSLESEVASDIAQQIRLHLLSGAGSNRFQPPLQVAVSRQASPHPIAPEAHELYLKGRFYFNQRSREALQKSVACFGAAIASEPGYAAAYAGLADSYNLIAFYGFDPSLNAVAQAKVAADKALQLDNSIAAAHAARAYTEFMWRGDWSVAEREFRQAIELDDNYVPAHQWYALYLAGSGRMDESLQQMREAQQLDPLSPAVHAGLGYMYYLARDYDQADQQARVALQMNPDFMSAHAVLGWADIQQKKYPEAIAELQAAARLSSNVPIYLCGLGRAYALSGNVEAARKMLADAGASSPEPRGNGSAVAALYLALGDSEQALHWLEMTAPGDIQANWLRVDPAFDSLRGNARFETIVGRIGAGSE